MSLSSAVICIELLTITSRHRDHHQPTCLTFSPFNFNRTNPSEYSLVELKTIQDVGGPEKFKDWKITREREMFLPQRFPLQEQKRQAENDRLRKLGLPLADDTINQMPHLMAATLHAAKTGA